MITLAIHLSFYFYETNEVSLFPDNENNLTYVFCNLDDLVGKLLEHLQRTSRQVRKTFGKPPRSSG